ncbi:MAG TPA: dihydrodipicolinate synthase family protein, partial [Bauldia sp.]|nr:dihydrodipicolinate synthase family protein [Bauldia sp.]
MGQGNSELVERISQGILAFPTTAFDPQFGLDVERTAGEMERMAGEKPAALVVAGGAGEIFSLDAREHAIVVEAAVRQAGDVPVIAGVGGGIAAAIAMAEAAERLGADAILLFPPYLTRADQQGLIAYVSAICARVGIGVIAYSRDNGVLSAETALSLAARHG